jgi:hypothetical protein
LVDLAGGVLNLIDLLKKTRVLGVEEVPECRFEFRSALFGILWPSNKIPKEVDKPIPSNILGLAGIALEFVHMGIEDRSDVTSVLLKNPLTTF